MERRQGEGKVAERGEESEDGDGTGNLGGSVGSTYGDEEILWIRANAVRCLGVSNTARALKSEGCINTLSTPLLSILVLAR